MGDMFGNARAVSELKIDQRSVTMQPEAGRQTLRLQLAAPLKTDHFIE